MSNLREWSELEAMFRETIGTRCDEWVDAGQQHYAHALDFAVNRFAEGRELVDWFLAHFEQRPIRILDVGSGNGGASLALANNTEFHVTAIDDSPNADLLSVRHDARLPLRYVVSDARRLPFASGAFDAVLCLEVIEHVSAPERMGAEIMRLLRPGGVCMLTTAARIPHLLGPDPHFRIRGLLLLPDVLQERAARRLRPALKGYDVEHIFWTVGGIARCFPGRRRVTTLVNIPFPGTPTTLRQWTQYILRRFLWNRILITR